MRMFGRADERCAPARVPPAQRRRGCARPSPNRPRLPCRRSPSLSARRAPMRRRPGTRPVRRCARQEHRHGRVRGDPRSGARLVRPRHAGKPPLEPPRRGGARLQPERVLNLTVGFDRGFGKRVPMPGDRRSRGESGAASRAGWPPTGTHQTTGRRAHDRWLRQPPVARRSAQRRPIAPVSAAVGAAGIPPSPVSDIWGSNGMPAGVTSAHSSRVALSSTLA